jgi:hypothetical protein
VWTIGQAITAWSGVRVGLVYVYRSPEDAAGAIEAMDLEEGFYLRAFSNRGEVIEVGSGDCLPR